MGRWWDVGDTEAGLPHLTYPSWEAQMCLAICSSRGRRRATSLAVFQVAMAWGPL